MTIVSRIRSAYRAHYNTAELPKHPLTKLARVLQVMQVLLGTIFARLTVDPASKAVAVGCCPQAWL